MNRKLLGLVGILLLMTSYCKLQTSEKQVDKTEHYYLQIPEGGVKTFLKYPAQHQMQISAHRGGGDYEGYPENCIASFEFILQNTPAMIECDVRSTADGVLVLLHDDELDRTTTGTGKLENKTWKEIKKLKLKDNFGNITDHTIPTLEEALQWTKGKTMLSLDVKRKISFEKVIALVKTTQTQDYVNIITYTVGAAQKVYQLAPDLMISCTIRNDYELQQYNTSGVPWENIIAFVGTKEPQESLYKALHEKRVLCILGAIGNLDRSAKSKGDKFYRNFASRGADIIATDRPLAASKAIRKE